MRKTVLSLALIGVFASQAMAQQPPADPTQALVAEWQAFTLSTSHVADKIQGLLTAYKQAVVELQGAEAQKATLIEWLKEAQAGQKAPAK